MQHLDRKIALQRSYTPVCRKRGFTLIELMVGLALGLMVVAVAATALITSRGVTGTVSDASTLQQQASYAFNVIGRQIRQAGSIGLNLNPDSALSSGGTDSTLNYLQPVAFDAPNADGTQHVFDRKINTVSGTSSPTVAVTVGYQNYLEKINPETGSTLVTESQLRDCLGQNLGKTDLSKAPVLTSTFKRDADTNALVCTGTGITQPVIENVTDFQVQYLTQAPSSVNMQYAEQPSDISDWSRVYAIEVCLELTGTDSIGGTAGQTYKNCKGEDESYNGRLKVVFRNTYQVRSQGQME